MKIILKTKKSLQTYCLEAFLITFDYKPKKREKASIDARTCAFKINIRFNIYKEREIVKEVEEW